jgi:hypothetical protein
MFRELENLFWDGSLSKLFAVFSAAIGLVFAFYVTARVNRLTERQKYLGKELNAEIGPWLTEVKRKYAAQHLTEKKSPK